MKYIHDEFLFKSYDEALKFRALLKDNNIALYTCAKCAIHYGSADPYTSDYGIVCRVCARTMNLSEIDNYRPEDYFSEDYDDLNEIYGKGENK